MLMTFVDLIWYVLGQLPWTLLRWSIEAGATILAYFLDGLGGDGADHWQATINDFVVSTLPGFAGNCWGIADTFCYASVVFPMFLWMFYAIIGAFGARVGVWCYHQAWGSN